MDKLVVICIQFSYTSDSLAPILEEAKTNGNE